MAAGREMGASHLGALVLPGTEGETTCANGLPLAPAAVRMLGRFYRIQAVDDHPNLCRHIAIVRCTTVQNTAIVISEHYKESVDSLIEEERLHPEWAGPIAAQLASALAHLHEHGVVAGLADLSALLVVPSQTRPVSGAVPVVRLAKFGIHVLSDAGTDTTALAGAPMTLSPERLLCPEECGQASRKSDVWAFGCIAMQMALNVLLRNVWTSQQLRAVIQTAIENFKEGESLLWPILQALRVSTSSAGLSLPLPEGIDKKQPTGLLRVAEECLRLRPSERPSMQKVKDMLKEEGICGVDGWAELTERRAETIEELREQIKSEGDDWILRKMPQRDAFFLWTLCGSTVERYLLDQEAITLLSPVLTLPIVTVEELRMFGNEEGRLFRCTTDIVILPMNNLRQKLLAMDPAPGMHSYELEPNGPAVSTLPLIVKEKDVSYQCARLSCISRLLSAHSFRPSLLLSSVSSDIPPCRRAAVWRALLGVSELDGEAFTRIDTVSPHPSDRQLDVDIPRCHQYEELMTSPSGQSRMRRLLKAWLLTHPGYVYWQGLDSLAAPFLLLNFGQLDMAWACMSRFIDIYLKDFFLKDNSAVIQEYLAVFSHLLAFVDATLYTCLADMDFFPELFAIPWFLTCFAHVLPLHKLFHVWDALLQADASFPLFVGVSILLHFRPYLIGSSFNDVILFFSDLPDMKIERILADSLAFYKRVPKSCAFLSQMGTMNCGLPQLSATELKSFSCPRLSPSDFVSLVANSSIAAVDLRPQLEFQRVSVVRSVNVPRHVARNAAGNATEAEAEDAEEEEAVEMIEGLRVLLQTAQANHHPICVYDGRGGDTAKKVSARLVRAGVCFVCILHGGFESVRNQQNILQTRAFSATRFGKG